MGGCKDHPHACGDKAAPDIIQPLTVGSSPCVWGQDASLTDTGRCARIIPMRVGTSLLSSDVVRISKDHPHACGDKVPAFAHDFKTAGSSPCVWGQAELVTIYGIRVGIIPMRVGTRQQHLYNIRYLQDHPHACGDKSSRSNKTGQQHGSSPCVWGQGSAYVALPS